MGHRWDQAYVLTEFRFTSSHTLLVLLDLNLLLFEFLCELYELKMGLGGLRRCHQGGYLFLKKLQVDLLTLPGLSG